MDLFVKFLISLTGFFGGNLGLTIIFIGIVSRLIFYPFLKSSQKHLQIQRDLKPKLDELKRKYAKDRSRYLSEQTKLMQESGFNPAAGCLAPLVQAVVGILLFFALRELITSGVNTEFIGIDLAKPDTWSAVFHVEGFFGQLPGVLVILTSIATLIQSKMMLPQALPQEKQDSKRELEKKEDLADALAASQGQFVYLFPLLILFTGRLFPAGLALFWLVSTLVGAVQQYYISGLGGLSQWQKMLRR